MSLRRTLDAVRARDAAVARYLAGSGPYGLHLGAGTHVLAGWFNTDLVPAPPDIHFLDSTRRLPFPDGALDHVLSEHHLEHLTYDAGRAMLAECLRVLRPGGLLRVATPSLEVLAGLVGGTLDERQRRYVDFVEATFLPSELRAGVAGVVNNAFRSWGHQFLYDRPTLGACLAGAGFVDLVETAPGRSEHPALQGVEGHGDFLGDEQINAFETMVFEARRP